MTSVRFLFAPWIAMIALMLLAVPAGASLTVQNVRADWEALTSGVFTIDFGGLAPANNPYYTDYGTAGGLTLSGVNFVGFTGEAGAYNLKVYNPTGAGNWGSGDYLMGGWSPGYILATLPAGGVTAAGVELATNLAGRTVTVTLSSGDSYDVPTYASPARAFFGFVSDTPITSMRFSAPSTLTVVDNFSVGSAETPEPDAFILGGAGLLGLLIARQLRPFVR